MKFTYKIVFGGIMLVCSLILLRNIVYSTIDSPAIPVDENPRGVAINPQTDIAIVSNEKDNSVSVVDLISEQIIATVPVGKFPIGIAVDAELDLSIAGNSHDDTVSLIDLNTFQIITALPAGRQPEGIALNPLSHIALVANHKDDAVTIIDLINQNVIGTVPVGQEPIDIAVDPELNLGMVVNEKDYSVSVIDLSTLRVAGSFLIGKKPRAIAVNPESHLAAVVNEKDNSITVINLFNWQTSTIPVCTHPLDIAINPLDNSALVVCDEERSLLLMDLDTGNVIHEYALNKLPKGVAVNSFTNVAGIVDDKTDSLTLIQLPNPVPTITSVMPNAFYRGSSTSKVTIQGSGFIKTSSVSLEPATILSLTTYFIDNHTLEVEIPQEILSETGKYEVKVTNPAPDGGASNPVVLTIVNPVPQITVLDPLEVLAGLPTLSLKVHGTGFFDDTKICINGVERVFNLISSIKLQIDLTLEDLEAGGYLELTISSPAPGGGISDPAIFTVLNPVPVLSSTNPTSVTAGSHDFALTLTGDNFVKTSVVNFNGHQYPAVYKSTTEIKTTIPESSIQTVGEYPVTVINPSPGGGETSPLTFMVKPPLEIDIISPSDGEVVNNVTVMVKGTVTSSTNDIGVKVNGMTAELFGGEWTANNVPLALGSNTITAVVADSYGNTNAETISINTDDLTQHVRLSANITSGMAPLKTYFSVSTSFTPTSYQMDFEGDGNVDYTETEFEDVSHSYTAEGVFYPTATIVDDQGNTYTDTIAITILNKTELDALLGGKWEGMKEALANKDVEGAMNYYCSESQERYRYIFIRLVNLLPDIVSNMQDIEMISVLNGVAEYRIRKMEDVGEVTYYIYFVKDNAGLWKIDQF
jgi:YVTN family beta-propeller protein